MIVRRGYRPPPSLHIERLRAAPPGHFYDVVSHGFGAMPDYAAQIAVRDRWAIVAYIRALQLSQNAEIADVPEAARGALFSRPRNERIGDQNYHRVTTATAPRARRRRARARALPRRLFYRSRAIFSLLSDRLYVLAGHPVGLPGIVMIHHLVGGTWGFVIQRSLESAIRTFPILAVLFLHCCSAAGFIYLGAPQAVAQDPVLLQKAAYLNIPAFIVRAAVYFTVWFALGYFLSRWSAEQDRSADPALTQRLQTLSGPGLVLYGLTVTFSAIDWLMSLEPHWYSTIFGMLFMVSHGLIALTFVIGAAYFLSRREPLSRIIAPWVLHDWAICCWLHDVVGLHVVCAVPDYLGGKSPTRNSLVICIA